MSGGILRRGSAWLLRRLLRGPLRRPLESVLVRLGHRFPRRLFGRGVIAEELLRIHAGGTVIARLADGPLLAVPATREAFVAYLSGRTFAEDEVLTTLLRRQLAADDVFVDVGSNVGYYAILAAQRGAFVHAFEAQPALVEHLRESVTLNAYDGRVTVVHAAVADRDGGWADLFTAHDGDTLLGVASLLRHEWLRDGVRIRVPVLSIDGYVRDRGLSRVDVVKIDVEGAESLVLRGMRDVLARLRPRLVIIERWPDTLRFESIDPGVEHRAGGAERYEEARTLLAELGYQPRRFDANGVIHHDLPAAVSTGPSNVAFVPVTRTL